MIFRNTAPKLFLEDEDYWDLFREITSNEDALFILIVDIFDIEASILPEMIEKLEGKNVILVANKRDLLPKQVKDEKIMSSVLENKFIKKLNILDSVCISTKKKYNIDLLLGIIDQNLREDAFLVGCANVGKSSLVNALINSITGDNQQYIAASHYAGTTLGLIQIPLRDGYVLIDTPGIINTSDLSAKLSGDALDIVIPRKEIRPRTYQLNGDQALFLTGYIEVDYLSEINQGITLYLSNEIKVHRTKLENSENLRENHLGGKLLFPPSVEELKNIKFVEKEIRVPSGNHDIVINGLGWINIKNKGKKELIYRVIKPDFVGVELRRGLI